MMSCRSTVQRRLQGNDVCSFMLTTLTSLVVCYVTSIYVKCIRLANLNA